MMVPRWFVLLAGGAMIVGAWPAYYWLYAPSEMWAWLAVALFAAMNVVGALAIAAALKPHWYG